MLLHKEKGISLTLILTQPIKQLFYTKKKILECQELNPGAFGKHENIILITTIPNHHLFRWFIMHYILLLAAKAHHLSFKECETGGELCHFPMFPLWYGKQD